MTGLVRIGGAGADETALANLERYTREAEGAFASATEKALASDTRLFSSWCSSEGVAYLPASPQTVARFVDAMAKTRAPATISRYVSSIAHLHRAAEVANPAASGTVKNALKRVRRKKGVAQAQAAPLTRKLIASMLRAGGTGPRDTRNRALLAVAYDTLGRRSELAALMREDLELLDSGAATVNIRRSKVDQEGKGSIRYLRQETVQALLAWLDMVGREGPLFRSVGKAGAIGPQLQPREVTRIFKDMALRAGMSPYQAARISAHSSRVGGAVDMVLTGTIELIGIMQAGGWSTPAMVAHYTRKAQAENGAAAQLANLQREADAAVSPL